MVCPVCIIPIVGGATALGTGSKAFSKTISKNLKWILLGTTLFLILVSLYFLIYKDKLSEECDSCKMPEN